MKLDDALLALLKGIKTECIKENSCSTCPFAEKHIVQKHTIPVTYGYEYICSIGAPQTWTLEIDDLGNK